MVLNAKSSQIHKFISLDIVVKLVVKDEKITF
jgi:hypothetical protein